MATTPISELATTTMRLFAALDAQATPESPYAQAREALGDRFLDVVTDALRTSMKDLLTKDGPEVQEELRVMGVGEIAARARLLGVAQAAFDAVIAAGAPR